MNKMTKLLRLAGAFTIVLAAAAPTASLADGFHGKSDQGRAQVHATVAPKDQRRDANDLRQPVTMARNSDRDRDAMHDARHMPPDRVEHRTPMPHKDFVWHKGHWRFDRGQWVWIAGLWLAR